MWLRVKVDVKGMGAGSVSEKHCVKISNQLRGSVEISVYSNEQKTSKTLIHSPAEKLADHPLAGRRGSDLKIRTMAPESAVSVMVGGLLAEKPDPE